MILFGMFPGLLVFVVDEVEAFAQIVVVSHLFALVVVVVCGRSVAAPRGPEEGTRFLRKMKQKSSRDYRI